MSEKEKSVNKKAVVLEALNHQRACGRSATAKRKSRGEVSGGGKKPWRQKGTGRARQGSTRAVQWRGGGCAFGSSERNYVVKMNRKARRAALDALLEEILEGGRVKTLSLDFEAPSTKKLAGALKDNGLEGSLLLLYGGDFGPNVVLSARNMPNVRLLHVDNLNPRDLLAGGVMVLGENDKKKIFGEGAG